MPLPERLPGTDLLVIGCSAGGFEALRSILPLLPRPLGMAVVVVVHLMPGRESLLPKTFSGLTSLPVKEAEDKELVMPGAIYVAPPNYHLLVDPGDMFSLTVEDPVHCSRPSIDVFFESVAHVYGSRALGVLLTGANADGAAGLEAIRVHGGLTVVEDPRTARFPQMPSAGLAAGHPSFVLPLGEIATWLARITAKEDAHDRK